MLPSRSAETRAEAVGIFDDAGSLQDAIDELLRSGVNQAEISLPASEPAVQETPGNVYEKVKVLEDAFSVPRATYVSTESRGDAEGGRLGGHAYIGAVAAEGAAVATGGTLGAAVAATAMTGDAGGLLGTVPAKFVADNRACRLQEQPSHGGLPLWVRTGDQEHERRAVEILSRHSAQDAHTLVLPAAVG